MKLYFDLDKKQLVKPPGEGGVVRSVGFIRGDFEPLELHFYRGGVEVAAVTNIVSVIKAQPGEESPSLAQCIVWEEGETGYTGELNLNGTGLNDLLSAQTAVALLF